MSELIRELSDYKLVVDDSVERDGSKSYQVVNKVYGVVEAETFILPQAFDYLEQIQAALDAGQDIAEELLEEATTISLSAKASYNH
jgi:hypothetical protein